MLAWLKQRYGILISDCEATTNWTKYTTGATMTITTSAVITDPKDDNYKEDGDYVIKCAGTADGSGNFEVVYTPSASISFSGVTADEYISGWLTYFSTWIKTTQAGTFRITLVDNAGKTAYWNITVTAGYQGYKHNLLSTFTTSEGGFDLTKITSIRMGYRGMSASAAATFYVDGLRVQGDPTFDYFNWHTSPTDEQMKENVVVISWGQMAGNRNTGSNPERTDEPDKFGMGPQPIMLSREPVDIGYQIIPDPTSNKSVGLVKEYRVYLYGELDRIIRKHNRDLVLKGIDYIDYYAHVKDDNFRQPPGRARGFFIVRPFVWHNTHGEST